MSEPRVAITFDDGPSTWTAPILDLLAEHDQNATFFVLGCNIIGQHQDALPRMVAEGHEIAMHGWDHTELSSLTSDALTGQIMLTMNAIRHACGATPRCWRSPWGKTDDRSADVIHRAGLRIVGLGLDAYDCDRDQKAIEAAVLSQLSDEAIITLHDGVSPNGRSQLKTRENTLLALPAILDACKSVTVSELLA